jgi:hypothetical protein
VDKIEVRPKTSGTQKVFQELRGAVGANGQLSISSEEIALSQRVLLSFALSSIRGGSRVVPTDLPDDFKVTGRFGSLYA